MALKWSPQVQDFDRKKLLEGNKKVGLLNSKESSPLVQHSASNLVDGNSPFSRLRDSVSGVGEAASQASASQASLSNQVRQRHNSDVDDKVEAEAFMKAWQESQDTLSKGRANLNISMNPNASKFGNSPVGSGEIGSLSGLGLSGEQQNVANSIISIGRQRGLGDDDIKIALMTGLVESDLRNLKYGDRDSQGVFQQRPSQGWGSVAQVTDVNYSTNKFYDALSKTKRKSTLGLTAQAVQRSAYPDKYDKKAPLAGRILAAANNPVGNKITQINGGSTGKWLQSQVGKKHDFDGMYGTQCVDFFRYYNQFQGFNATPSMGRSGGAKEMWENPAQVKAMTKNYNQVGRDQKSSMGDVAVFNGNLGSGYGHVGVVLKDLGDRVQIINSNSSTVGNGKPTNIVTISKKNLSGYYRPKKMR